MKQSHPMTEQKRKLDVIRPFKPKILHYDEGDFSCRWDNRVINFWNDGTVSAVEIKDGLHAYCDDDGIDDAFLIAFARGGFDEVRRVSRDSKALQAVVNTTDTPATTDYDNF